MVTFDDQTQLYEPVVKNGVLSLKVHSSIDANHAALAYLVGDRDPKIAPLQLLQSEKAENHSKIYQASWNIKDITDDDIVNGKIIFVDLDTNARFQYGYVKSVKSKHFENNNFDVNVKFDSLNSIMAI